MFYNSSALKLAASQLFNAWKSFPTQKRNLKSNPKGGTILVTGPYRSGTSWVSRMLAGSGIWHLHEPFNPNQGIWPDYFSYRRRHESDVALDEIVDSLRKGQFLGIPDKVLLRGIPANHRCMPSRLGLYTHAIRRTLIKDPIACLLSEYLVVNHAMTAVVVMRHPAGFASSLSQLGWDTAEQLRNLLKQCKLMEDWLFPYEPLMALHSKASSLESHTTLFAALWIVLWGFAQRNNRFLIVNYEELCESPQREFEKLHTKLNLPLLQEDRKRHYKLTQSPTIKTPNSPFDVVRNTKAVRRSWSRTLRPDEIDTVRSVWETFELPFFQNDSDW